jgi:YNFM family putative membrane transporter
MDRVTPRDAVAQTSEPSGGALWLVFLLVTCAFTSIYVTQPVLPILQQEFAVSASTASLSISAVILGMALTTIPLGVLADRHSIRPLILIGGTVAAVAGLVCALTRDFALLIAMRMMQGLCIPALTSCVAAYLSRTLQPHRLNVVMGVYVSATVAGGLGGRLLGGWIHPPLHWRYAFVTSAVALLVVSVVSYFRLHDTRPIIAATMPRVGLTLTQLLTLPALRRSLFAAFGAFGAFSTMFNYFPFYLAAPPWNLPTAVITSLYLAYVVGLGMGPLAGRLSNQLGNAKVMMGGVVVFVVSLVTTLIPSMFALVFSQLGICAGFFAIHSAAVGALNGALASDRGKGNALYTLFYYIGGVTGITAGGYLYTHAGWMMVVALCAAMLVLPLGAGIAEAARSRSASA